MRRPGLLVPATTSPTSLRRTRVLSFLASCPFADPEICCTHLNTLHWQRMPRVMVHSHLLSSRVVAALSGERMLRSAEILAPCCQEAARFAPASFSRINSAMTLTSGLEERSATRCIRDRILSSVSVRPAFVSSLSRPRHTQRNYVFVRFLWRGNVNMQQKNSELMVDSSSGDPLGTVRHTATHCNTLQHTATHCNTLQLTTTQCNTPQHRG